MAEGLRPLDETTESWVFEEIAKRLRCYDGLQAEAIRQAQRHRDAIGPLLIETVRDIRETNRERLDSRDLDALALICLLTEFQTPDGLGAILELLHAGEALIDVTLGDAAQELTPAILAGWIQEPAVLERLIRDSSFEPGVRWIFIGTMAYLVRDGHLSRNEAVSCLQAILRESIDIEDTSIIDYLCFDLGRYGSAEPLTTIREAFERELAIHWISDLRDIEHDIQLGDESFRVLMNELLPTGVRDTAEFLGNWDSKIEAANARAFDSIPSFPRTDGDDEFQEEAERSWVSASIHRSTAKVGRNDPCPCDSGKKYKKCCGHADRLIQ